MRYLGKKIKNYKVILESQKEDEIKTGRTFLLLRCQECGTYNNCTKEEFDNKKIEKCYYVNLEDKIYKKLYKVYTSMAYRCNNQKCKAYKHYGLRGIKVLWKDAHHFMYDMHKSYIEHVKMYGEKETTIDRINVNGNYSKRNCRWATREIQGNNRTNTKK